MLEKSLFICYSTPNYSILTNLFLKSLKDINVHKIKHKLDKPAISFSSTGFGTDLWYYAVRNKINYLIDVLNNNTNFIDTSYFIFTDCDIIFLKKNINEWINLEKFVINENKDIYFMREDTTNNVNSGFFIIKNNNNIKNIVNFFIKVLNELDISNKIDIPFGDQSVINKLKEKINYGFIPNDYVIFGTTIFNKNKSLFHHAIGCIDVEDKINQINLIKSKFF